jgi:2'-5' RNA ligase
MPFAIHLFFDPTTETTINQVWKNLAEPGIATYLYQSANRPHITLAIYQKLDLTACEQLLQSIAAESPSLPVNFQYVGVFPKTGAVFAGPTVTKNLLDLHHKIHETVQPISAEPNPYYLPGQWIPHCGLAIELAPELIKPAFEISLKLPLPLAGKITEIGCTEQPPVKHLFGFELGSDSH